jgi:hypothetical protein
MLNRTWRRIWGSLTQVCRRSNLRKKYVKPIEHENNQNYLDCNASTGNYVVFLGVRPPATYGGGSQTFARGPRIARESYPNKGGHRERAIELINQAIAQVEEGETVAR